MTAHPFDEDALNRTPHPPPILTVTDDDPPWLAWLLPLVMMLLVAAGLVWAVVGEVDIVAPEQAALVPSGRVKVIQSPEQRVVRRILVHEGQAVAAGDRLVEFDIDDASADRDRAAKELAAVRLRSARLRASLDGRPGFAAPEGALAAAMADEVRLFDADRAKLDGDLGVVRQDRARLEAEARSSAAAAAKLEAVIPLIRKRVDARRQLVERQIASSVEFLTLEQELVEAESDLRVEQTRLGVTQASIAATAEREEQVRRTRRMELTTALVEAETRAAALAEELRKAEQRLANLTLRAPGDGRVTELALHTVGGVVQPAQTLMKLVPTGAALEAEAKVLNRDVGFLEVGQTVQVKLDTFAFTKYGAIPGRVAAISSDAVVDERLGPVFHARVELERQTIEVDGRTVPLTAGMSATVDVRTGRRRVIDYLLAPIRKYTEEAIRER
jgi:hemolysin D